MSHHLFSNTLGIFLTDAFWLTTWFKVLSILILAIAGLVFHKLRVHHLINEKAILQSKLDECDELLLYAGSTQKKDREEILLARNSTGELLAKLSHEIRTPMNGVIGMTSLLSCTNLTGEQLQYVDSINSCSQSLINSINGLLQKHSEQHISNSQMNHIRPVAQHTNIDHAYTATVKLSDAFATKYPLRILVSEDNKMNGELITMILRRLGYTSDVALNGKQVLEKMEQNNYDLIFMDVEMPEMDGLEATRMIRHCLNAQPVIIAMTANAMRGDREECLRAGMDDYISKPLNIKELVSMLENWALHVKEKAKF
jgi:CheY-like chemotaxis protein